jgi:hypothetical protein
MAVKFKVGDIVRRKFDTHLLGLERWMIISEEEAHRLLIRSVINETRVFVKSISTQIYSGNGTMCVEDLVLVNRKSRLPLWL